MHNPSERHSLARLRNVIGRTQPEFASLVGCSTSTIVSVELGRLKLSEDLARRIAAATGISVGWLLANNPRSPLVAADGLLYERAHYEVAQSDRTFGAGPEVWDFDDHLFEALGRLFAVFFHLATKGAGRASLAFWRLQKAVEELEGAFGTDEPLLKAISGLEPQATPAGTGRSIAAMLLDSSSAFQTMKQQGKEQQLNGQELLMEQQLLISELHRLKEQLQTSTKAPKPSTTGRSRKQRKQS